MALSLPSLFLGNQPLPTFLLVLDSSYGGSVIELELLTVLNVWVLGIIWLFSAIYFKLNVQAVEVQLRSRCVAVLGRSVDGLKFINSWLFLFLDLWLWFVCA